MSYFDGLTEASFKKNLQGQTVFYPWGIFGNGYIIENNQQEVKLRKFTKMNYMISLPLVILNQIFFGYLPNLILLPIYVFVFLVLLKKLTRGLLVTEEKLKISESYRNSALKHNFSTLVLLGLSSFVFCVLGAMFIVDGSNILLGVFALILFGSTTIGLSYMAWIKIKRD